MTNYWATGVIATALAIGGGFMFHRAFRRAKEIEAVDFAGNEGKSEAGRNQHNKSLQDLLPKDSQWIQVQSVEALVSALALQGTLTSIRQRSSFSTESFDRDVLPVLCQTIELVQLLPASESHHHADPGGLAVHLLEVVNHALSIRSGFTLPRGVAAENIAKLQHVWTYAVVLGALFHDIGKPMSDLLILARKSDTTESIWHPLVGTLNQAGYVEYRLEFKSSAYQEHQKIAALLAQKIIPTTGMAWLASHPDVLNELLQYLSGDKKDSVLEEIIKRADSESVRNNLKSGSRLRFAASRSEPMIERLMTAIRAVLTEGGRVPLNRPGATGFIYEGEAYMTCKPLMQSAREWLAENNEKPIPGPDKDDRLYDTLQEYQAIIANPLTNGAIWSVQIEMERPNEKPWKQNLKVLRFPLDKLYKSPTDYPTSMTGVVRLLGTNAPQNDQAVTIESESTKSTALPVAQITDIAESATVINSTAEVEDATLESNLDQEYVDVEADEDSSAHLATVFQLSPKNDVSSSQLSADDDDSPHKSDNKANAKAPQTEYLSEDDMAISIGRTSAVAKPKPPKKPPQPEMLPPVVVPFKGAPRSEAKGKAEIPEQAMQFMRWLQESVATGKLTFNNSSALLHKVPEGLLLVSPKIFKAYANEVGEPNEMIIQRLLFKAGWHKKTDVGSINIMRYSLQSSSNSKTTMLSGIVLVEPERYFTALPPDNPVLSFNESATTATAFKKKSTSAEV